MHIEQNLIGASLAAAMVAGLTACGGEFSRPDTSGHEISLSVKPFYKDLMHGGPISADSLAANLERKYGGYFDTFCAGELRIGLPGDPGFSAELERFLSAEENGEVMAACDSVYDRLDADSDISDAFSCFAALFPGKPVPTDVYCHFSGFNDRMFVDSTYISFGIEHYLGAKCRFYEWLQIPVYARQTRDLNWLVSDLVKAWIYSTTPETSGKDDVLTALIYQGKTLYATHRCIPGIDEPTLLGMTEEQVEWCKANEARMWAYLAEHKLLYSTSMQDKCKIVNEGPFTSYFGNKSPGRAATYCAYNIVRGYARNHPDISLGQLMELPDAQEVLRGSRYNP